MNAKFDLGVAIFLLKQKQQKLIILNLMDQLFRTNLAPESIRRKYHQQQLQKNCINILKETKIFRGKYQNN